MTLNKVKALLGLNNQAQSKSDESQENYIDPRIELIDRYGDAVAQICGADISMIKDIELQTGAQCDLVTVYIWRHITVAWRKFSTRYVVVFPPQKNTEGYLLQSELIDTFAPKGNWSPDEPGLG